MAAAESTVERLCPLVQGVQQCAIIIEELVLDVPYAFCPLKITLIQKFKLRVLWQTLSKTET